MATASHQIVHILEHFVKAVPVGNCSELQCEIVLQLTGRAGGNQLQNPRIVLMQSVGGAAATVITHLFGV